MPSVPDYSCRLCRTPLAASKGCAVCDDWRRNLVISDENSEESPALAVVGAEVVRALRKSLDATSAELAAAATDPVATKRLIALGNTTAKVLEAARKLQSDGVSAVKAMSFAERTELFLAWYADLPPGYRATVRKAMARFELKLGPRPLSGGDDYTSPLLARHAPVPELPPGSEETLFDAEVTDE